MYLPDGVVPPAPDEATDEATDETAAAELATGTMGTDETLAVAPPLGMAVATTDVPGTRRG